VIGTDSPLMTVTNQVIINTLTVIFTSSDEIIVIRATDNAVERSGKTEIAP